MTLRRWEGPGSPGPHTLCESVLPRRGDASAALYAHLVAWALYERRFPTDHEVFEGKKRQDPGADRDVRAVHGRLVDGMPPGLGPYVHWTRKRELWRKLLAERSGCTEKEVEVGMVSRGALARAAARRAERVAQGVIAP